MKPENSKNKKRPGTPAKKHDGNSAKAAKTLDFEHGNSDSKELGHRQCSTSGSDIDISDQHGGAHCIAEVTAPAWFQAFEHRFSSFEDSFNAFIANTRAEIQNITDTVDMKSKLTDDRFIKLERKYSDLEIKLDDLENRSRRQNLVFFNIPENSEPNPSNCVDWLTTFIGDFVGVQDQVGIERAHRTPSGPVRDGQNKPRPVTVCFSSYITKELVRKACITAFKSKQFNGHKLYVSEDLSKRVQARRKELWPKLKELRDEGKKAFFQYPATLKFVDNGVLKVYKAD